MEAETACGFIPAYPIITPDSSRELFVRGLGRNKICPYPGGVTKFHTKYMTTNDKLRKNGYNVGVVVQNTKPSIVDYIFPFNKMDKFYEWEEKNFYSLPKYVEFINAHYKNVFTISLGWTEAQYETYGPAFEIMKSPVDNYNYLHFKHQAREAVGSVPRPDLSGLHLYVTYVTTRELRVLGVMFGDICKETCGWPSHGYKEPLYLKHGYFYPFKGYFDNPYADYWGAIQSAEQFMEEYPVKKYGDKYANWLSTFDARSAPPASYKKLVFRGNEADFLERLLTRHVFNEPFVGEILSEKVKVTLSSYAADLTKNHCILEFSLGERYEEVMFVLSEAILMLLNWSFDSGLEDKFIRSGGSEPAGANEPSWNLSRATNPGEGYLLTLRAQHNAAKRTVKVDMGTRAPPTFFPTPELLDNRALCIGAAHNTQDGLVRGVDRPLQPAGLRLIQVADQRAMTTQNNMPHEIPATVDNSNCRLTGAGANEAPICNTLSFNFTLSPLERGRAPHHLRKMYRLNEMAFIAEAQAVDHDTGESLPANIQTSITKCTLPYHFFEKIKVILRGSGGSSEDRVLYESGGLGRRRAEQAIIGMFTPPTFSKADLKTLQKELDKLDFRGSRLVDVNMPLFINGGLPTYDFFSKAKIDVQIVLALPHTYLRVGSREKPLNLRITHPRLYVPSVAVDTRAERVLSPLLESHLIAHVYNFFDFEHDTIEQVEVSPSRGWDYTHTLQQPYIRGRVLAYVLGVSNELEGESTCEWGQHGIFSTTLTAPNGGLGAPDSLHPP